MSFDCFNLCLVWRMRRWLAIACPCLLSAQELSWDETAKVYRGTTDVTSARFTFEVTNRTGDAVVIEMVHASCGCTTTELPTLPWTLAPGESGRIGAVLNVTGKPEFVEKTLTVVSTLSTQVLTMQVFLSPETGLDADARRERNLALAQADRQAIFRPDCASCHAPPLVATAPAETLFSTMCAICHEAPRRAAVVPDLAVSRGPRDEAFWIKWIAEGRAGSLMPAFAREHGGVLSAEEVRAVADYAARRFAAPEERRD